MKSEMIKLNIAEIRAKIEAAAIEAGRDPKEITLVGASKMNDADACKAAIAAGIDVLGENRVQEMTQKLGENAYEGAPLHFIGHLQRNKVTQVVGKVDLIQSVGSLSLLEAIDKEAEKQGLVQDILLEVNIGEEEAKSGFAPADMMAAAAAAKELKNVRVRGLMTIPPFDATREENLAYFQRVRALFVDINEKMFHNELEHLSQQYQKAIEAKAKEAEFLYNAYQKSANTMSATQRSQKEEAIVAKEKEAMELRQKYFGNEGEMRKKEEELIAPIQNQIYEAVKQISMQKGYDIVIDRASANSMIYASPKIDISNEILRKLGYSK